jgi:hypothetical protein
MKRIALALLTLAGIALTAPPASATPQTDKCVTTTVFRDNGQLVYAVEVKNACNFTLQNVNQHVYNGPAGIDKTYPCCYDLPPGKSLRMPFLFPWNGPKGSLTCGEIWASTGDLWGRDCRTEP